MAIASAAIELPVSGRTSLGAVNRAAKPFRSHFFCPPSEYRRAGRASRHALGNDVNVGVLNILPTVVEADVDAVWLFRLSWKWKGSR